jgi:hypothetical protein
MEINTLVSDGKIDFGQTAQINWLLSRVNYWLKLCSAEARASPPESRPFKKAWECWSGQENREKRLDIEGCGGPSC